MKEDNHLKVEDVEWPFECGRHGGLNGSKKCEGYL